MQIGSTPMMPPGPSPRDQAVASLEAQVEAGEITADDQDAMLEALDAMHAERMENGPPPPNSTRPTKEEIQANFESMLDDQIEAGTIDQDQAEHLLEMFEEGEIGRPPGAKEPPPGENGSAMMEELMSAILTQMQSSSAYDGSGDQSDTDVTSLLADYTAYTSKR